MDNLENNTVIHESEVSFFPTALRWGLIAAAIFIIYALISNLLGFAASQAILSSLISTAITIVIAYLAIKSHRQELGGFITFGRGFLVAFVALVISGLIASIFNFVYMNYIDPGAMDEALKMSQEMMSGFGMSEDQIEMAMEDARASMESPLSIISGLVFISVISAIFSAIVAAVMKNVRPTGF